MSEQQRLTRSYSQRLGVLRAEQLQAALDRFDLGALVDAEPAPGGLFGQNVFLTSTRGAWVLRGCPHFPWQLPKERFAARLIHERTSLAAPWPYWIEESPQLFGWSYALMPRLPGAVASGAGRDAADGRAYAAALGEGLARLHALRGEAPGSFELDAGGVVPFPLPHAERVIGQVHERLAGCRAAREGCVAADDEEWIEGLLAAPGVRAALDEPFEPSWVHHDWKPNNVLAESGAGRWRITGVVDLMEGYFGDGEEDLVRSAAFFAIGDRGRVRRFTGAYREARPLRPGFAERYRVYQLVDCLVIWEYGQRNRVWFPEDLRLRAFAEPFVTGIEPF